MGAGHCCHLYSPALGRTGSRAFFKGQWGVAGKVVELNPWGFPCPLSGEEPSRADASSSIPHLLHKLLLPVALPTSGMGKQTGPPRPPCKLIIKAKCMNTQVSPPHILLGESALGEAAGAEAMSNEAGAQG